MRSIRVTGKGQLKLRPDTTRVTLNLEGLEKDYSQALERSARDSRALRELIGDYGFAPEDLKTLNFSVDTEYESYQDKTGVYRQRFAGYRFRHSLRLAFPSDNQRLGKLLSALAGSPVQPELRLSYTVSDPEKAKNELLARAVSDARAKAETLTAAAGVALGEIQNMDYSWDEIDFSFSPMERGMPMAKAMAADSIALDLEPEDIPVSDTVTVVWEIG